MGQVIVDIHINSSKNAINLSINIKQPVSGDDFHPQQGLCGGAPPALDWLNVLTGRDEAVNYPALNTCTQFACEESLLLPFQKS